MDRALRLPPDTGRSPEGVSTCECPCCGGPVLRTDTVCEVCASDLSLAFRKPRAVSVP